MKTLVLALMVSASAAAQTSLPADDTLIFQTGNGWSPRVNVEAGTVMNYGIDKDLPEKPSSPRFHDAIAAWVRAGGALVVMDTDADPYNHAQDWWNSNGTSSTTPRELLSRSLGIDPQSEGTHRVGKGVVLFRKTSPSALTAEISGPVAVLDTVREAAQQVHVAWREASALVLRRGPFVIAAGFDKPEGAPEHPMTRVAGSAVTSPDAEPSTVGNRTAPSHTAPAPTRIPGRYIDLFDAHLRVVAEPQVDEGQRRLLFDPTFFPATKARVLAASAKVIDEQATPDTLRFAVSDIDSRDTYDLTAIRLLLPREAKTITLNGKPLAHGAANAGTVFLEFPANYKPQYVEVTF